MSFLASSQEHPSMNARLVLVGFVALLSVRLVAGEEDDYKALNRIVAHATLTLPSDKQERLLLLLDEGRQRAPFLVKDATFDLPLGGTWRISLLDRAADGSETWLIQESTIGGKNGPFLGYEREGDRPGFRLFKEQVPGTVWRIEWMDRGKRHLTAAEGKWKGWFLNSSEDEEKQEVQLDGMKHRFTRRAAQLTLKPGPRSALAFSPLSRQR
jgi:hypothetical protein